MIKRWINALAGMSGHQFIRQQSLEQDIAAGKYRWLQEMNIRTVLDIGANTGQFAGKIRRIIPHAMIYSFEPLMSCFKELEKNSTRLMPMKCFPIALGKERAELTMHRNEFSPGSSILPAAKRVREAFPFMHRSEKERISVRTLDEVAPELLLKPAVLSKVDVQGYELEVLKGAEKTLPLVDVLILETSFEELYVGQPLFEQVHRFLNKRRFSYGGSFAQIHDPKSGAVLQQDSLFFNTQRKVHAQ